MDSGEAPHGTYFNACGAADGLLSSRAPTPAVLCAPWTQTPAQAPPQEMAEPDSELDGLSQDAAKAPFLTHRVVQQWHPMTSTRQGLGQSLLQGRRPHFAHRMDVAAKMQEVGLAPSESRSIQGEGAVMNASTVMDIMEASSPMPSLLTSRSHLDVWHEASETLLILDWDDTLFPTTYVWTDPRLRWDEPAPCFNEAPDLPAHADKPEGPTMHDLLGQHASTVAAFLRLAVTLGKVVIVTLAEEGWVDLSIKHFLPSLDGLLLDLGIEVAYCRSTVTPRLSRRANEDGYSLGKLLKTQVIARVVKEFYSAGGDDKKEKSWKNVLSIGDSSIERLALQDVIFQRKQKDSKGDYKVCRCKVIKIISEPNLEMLIAQVQVLAMWLQKLAWHDGDVDLDFSELEMLPPDSPLPSA